MAQQQRRNLATLQDAQLTAYGEHMEDGLLALLHVVVALGHEQDLKILLQHMAVLHVTAQQQRRNPATRMHAQLTAHGELMVSGLLALLRVVEVKGHVQELKIPLQQMAVLHVVAQQQTRNLATL